jgi:hypothetical protein
VKGNDMPVITVPLPWGKEKISLSLPENWNLMGVMEPSPLPDVSDPVQEVELGINAL